MKVEDGIGSGKLAKVNSRNRLDISSATFSESHLVAALDAETYLWTTSFSAATGNEIIYIKNNSKTKLLVIDKVTVNGVNAGLFELFQVTGTASGTSITGKNSNLTSGNSADATALGEASVTGLTIGDRIDLARIPANGRATMELQDVLLLGFNDAIAITYTGSTGIVDAIVTGYYETLDGI
jgi:hypothetical protein